MKSLRSRSWLWACVSITAGLLGPLGVSVARGQVGDGPEPLSAVIYAGRAGGSGTDAGSPRQAAADASAPLRVLRAGSSCGACEPSRTEVEIVFSSPVDAAATAARLSVEPALRLAPVQQGSLRRVVLRGPFVAQTRYRLELAAELCADDGACLAEATEFSVQIRGGHPRVRMPVRNTVLPPGRKIPIVLEHVDRATLKLVTVRPTELADALAQVGIHRAGRDPVAKLPRAMQRRMRAIELDREKDAPDGHAEVDPFADGRGPLVLAVLSGEHARTKVGLYQKGELAALLKLGTDGGLVWVTEQHGGRPLQGAQVTLMRGAETTFRGRTNASGLLMLPGSAKLKPSSQEKQPRLHALVTHGNRAVVVREEWTDALRPWMFDIPHYEYAGGRGIRGMITAERGIYRPGEPVHLLGILRRKLPDGTLAPPRGKAQLKLRAPDGSPVAEQSLDISPYGTVRSTVELPAHADVGRYHATLSCAGARLHSSFEVGEFRAATFEVQLPESGPAELDGDAIVVPVSAQYLYGAPVAKGKLAWSASWRHRRLHFKGLERFRFRGGGWYYYSSPVLMTSGESELDEDGRALLRIPSSALPEPSADQAQSLDLIVEATVRDAADDAVAARTVQRIDRAKAFVGVATRQWVVSPAQGWDVEVVAVDARGRPLPKRSLVLELHRTFWSSVAEKGPHGVRYRSSREEQLVSTREVQTTTAPTRVHLELVGGGDYELRVRDKSHAYVASQGVWAYGEQAVGPAENNPRVELRLDQDDYLPGQTAKVFAALPYPRSTALVTVERGGVMSAQVVELSGADKPIAVPITSRYLPNAFVGVAAVPRDAAGAVPASGYPFRAGYKEIRVSPESRRLKIDLEPLRADMEPGAQAVVRVRVTDSQGRPARAEVTVWAADEGVLMLTGYRTPDPFKPAYAGHDLEVRSALNLSRWTNFDPDYWADGGGDGGVLGTALRSRMLYTAFFSKGVVTDGRGQATVRFALPDNLTRWRLMAVAADRGQRFGKGEASIRVSKPLQIMPSLPRFATEGDLLDAGFVIHNHTGADAQAKVVLEVDGAEVMGKPSRQVAVAAGAQSAVRFPVVVRRAGRVSFRARAEAGGQRDGLQIELPAHRSTITQHAQLGAGKIDGSIDEWFKVPDGARAGSPELLVTVSPTVLASLEAGIDALLEYPYGCAEQKTSRLVPMVVLGDLIRDLGIGKLADEAHRRRLHGTIAEHEKHQNGDGGFGLWVESDSDGFITAYVLFGMLVAREHGYRVKDERVRLGVEYLQGLIERGELGSGYFEYDPRAFAAYVLGRAAANDHGLAKQLFEKRGGLSRFEQALLGSALSARDRPKAELLLGELGQAQKSEAAGEARVVERGSASSGYHGFGADVRATASAISALVQLDKAAEAAPLVAGILAARGGDGSWGTTYNNLWAVLALGEYAEVAGRPSSDEVVTVSLDGEPVTEMALSADLRARRLRLAAASLPGPGGYGRLGLTASGASGLRYSARLRFVPKAGAQPALEQGYRVERALFDAQSGDPVTRPQVGQLVRVRLRVRTSSDRHQVALTDRLPAGFEAVNARLQTEQQQVQTHSDWPWLSHEIRDERVSFFAYRLYDGEHVAEYLARASRSGEFVWPAVTAESMYNPNELGRGAVGQLVVTR